ncbi:DUF4870 domain-containing protein [Thalassotalea sp. PLHSN55]|uniref:DUF4870 domain-containing protein n=1 Tax=Thalassotalea sp. PLHSN55 TaxID=3435888 RepID=UPI003F84BA17
MSAFETQTKEHNDIEKIVAVLSYLTIIGWLVAVVIYGKNKSPFARFHLRQALGLVVATAIFAFIPLVGWMINIALLITWLIALYYALLGQQYLIPVVGEYFQEHFDFIS